ERMQWLRAAQREASLSLVLDAEDIRTRTRQIAIAAHFADASVYSTKLGAVSALREDDLHSFVGAYLAPKRARIVYVKPVRSALPADEKIETTHAAAKDRPRPPAADRVDTTAHVPSIGQLVKTVRLANGLEVLISKRATLPVVTV